MTDRPLAEDEWWGALDDLETGEWLELCKTRHDEDAVRVRVVRVQPEYVMRVNVLEHTITCTDCNWVTASDTEANEHMRAHYEGRLVTVVEPTPKEAAHD